ncbi:MAG: GNAT family N-acetyltransferase [Saccharofermentanales bacterium]
MDLIIRKAVPEDAFCMAEILTKSWMSAYKTIIPMDDLLQYTNVERRLAMFRQHLADPKENYYLALSNDVPCGLFFFGDSRDDDLADYGEIVAFYLLEEYWGSGFGREMMAYALHIMQSMKYTDVCLWVFKENTRARKFYEKCGFVCDGAKKISKFGNSTIEVRYRYHE